MVATNVPRNRCPVGYPHSVLAATPTVPVTVTTFGVTGVRASTSPTGVISRVKNGRALFSMAVRS